METKKQLVDPRSIKLPLDALTTSDEIRSLAESIKTIGFLQNPPIIKDNLELVSGKKRVPAAIIAGLDLIDVHVVPSDLPNDEYEAMSLHENLKRSNPTWYDYVIMEKRLHDLRQAQHGIATSGSRKGWSIRDTADELQISFGGLSQDLKVAEAVLADPSLKRVGDKKTALRIILDSTKRAGQQANAQAWSQIDSTVHLGGAEKILELYEDQTFDACITDPPWLEFKDESLTRDEYTLPVFKQVYRTLKTNSFLYMFVGTQDWYYYWEQLPKFGFNVQKWPMFWIKEGVLTRGTTSWQYQRNYELILLAVKGAPALTDSLLSSALSFPVVNSQKLIHPNEKPLSIIRTLLDHCSYKNSIILDPFGGSGVTGEACKITERRYVLIEKEPKYYHGILRRLEQ